MVVSSLMWSLSSLANVPSFGGIEPGESPVGPPTQSLPVTGGDDVQDPLDWAEVAGIVQRGEVVCTGTLIAPNLVITAGHCMSPSPGSVILGTNDYRDPGEEIDVAQAITYPNSWNTYDVGLLVLERDSQYTPRTIATDCIRDDIQDGAEVIVVGYGAIDAYGYRYTPILQEGTTVITDADCSHTDWGCNSAVTPNGEVGAGEDGVDACYGDSGGPLFLPTSRGLYLLGVTSRGWYGADCGEGGVWVRPDSPELFAWIEQEANVTLPRPECLEPTANALYAVKNDGGATQINPNYDEAPFTYTVTAQPMGGNVTVDDSGEAFFHPNAGFAGEDQVTIQVRAADGWSGSLTIPIKIVSRATYRRETGRSAPGGCDHSANLGMIGALAALALAATRRR